MLQDFGPSRGDSIEVLGVTFEEACARVGARRHELKGLRKSYAAALGGGRSPDGLLGRFRANVLPVVRELRDGELVKFVQLAADGLETESVIIPMERAGRPWKTLCVSSQVGCAMGCTFCETAQLGRLRSLTAAEIVGQVVAARRVFQAPIQNVVFMGMGEPFDNFDHVIQAVRVLSDPAGLAIAKERITISTVGRVDGIRRLRALGWRRINLAVSLNAPNDEIRSKIMPINRAEPMARLREALIEFPMRRCGPIMLEYVLIPAVNDRREHALELAEFCRPIKGCVNVIPYNPRRDSPWPAPTPESVSQFVDWLREAGQYCKQRMTKGRQLMAACGQLGNRELARNHRRLHALSAGTPTASSALRS
jgi:23S rRNA (adenine2503-C2)-methyltransferase